MLINGTKLGLTAAPQPVANGGSILDAKSLAPPVSAPAHTAQTTPPVGVLRSTPFPVGGAGLPGSK